MHKRTLGVVLLTGLALSGAGAFTASNTMSESSNVLGYGQSTATGVTVTDIAYTPLTTDNSKLQSVVFLSTDNLSAGVGKTAKMVLKGSGGSVLGNYSCTIGAYLVTNTITCATGDNPLIADVTATGITVVDS